METTFYKSLTNLLFRKKDILFAVTDGVYKGEFLVYIEEIDKDWCFLSLPDLYIRKIPSEEFKRGIELGIVESVKSLPNDIVKVIEAQYHKNKISTN